MNQRYTLVEERRWVNEPAEEDKENHALICYNCHLLVFGRRCLWHHCKKCVQLSRTGVPADLYGNTLLRTKGLWPNNYVYNRLFWIDCNVCEIQWPGRCSPCYATPWKSCCHLHSKRRARIAWVRYLYRVMCTVILKAKLSMIGSRELLPPELHPVVASFW
jgi:hypothetical protein